MLPLVEIRVNVYAFDCLDYLEDAQEREQGCLERVRDGWGIRVEAGAALCTLSYLLNCTTWVLWQFRNEEINWVSYLPFPPHLAGRLQHQQAAWWRTDRHGRCTPAGAPLVPTRSSHPGPRVFQQLLRGSLHQLRPWGTCCCLPVGAWASSSTHPCWLLYAAVRESAYTNFMPAK